MVPASGDRPRRRDEHPGGEMGGAPRRRCPTDQPPVAVRAGPEGRPSPAMSPATSVSGRRSSRFPRRHPGQQGGLRSSEPNSAMGSAPRTTVDHNGTGATTRPWRSSTRDSSIRPRPAPPKPPAPPVPADWPWPAPSTTRGRSDRPSISTHPIRGDHPPEDPLDRLGHRLLLFGEGEVHQAALSGTARPAEHRDSELVVHRHHLRHHGHADGDVGGVDADQVAHQAGAFVELHHRHDQGVVEAGHLGMVDDHEAVDRAPVRSRSPCPTRRTRTTRTPGAADGAACRTAHTLDEQLVPWHPRRRSEVVGDSGTGTQPPRAVSASPARPRPGASPTSTAAGSAGCGSAWWPPARRAGR